MRQQAKLIYSRFQKAYEKQTNTIEDQENKQILVLNVILRY